MAFIPTPEQQTIVQAFNQPGHPPIKVVARAGSGKSSTSRLLTLATPRRGIYLAFGKKNADEAREKFPKSCLVKTTHALAYAAMNVRETWGHKLKDEKNKWPLWKMVREFVICDYQGISANHIAHTAMQAVRRFCYSADDELAVAHVADPTKGYRYFEEVVTNQWKAKHPNYTEVQLLRWQNRYRQKQAQVAWAAYRDELLAVAKDLWAAMIDRDHPFPMEHDGYLKLWQLRKPIIQGIDYLIIDESQDQNSCVLDIVLNQTCQIIMIGDPDQNIFGFRMARNIMADLDALELYLSMSFRFGQPIADVANWILSSLHPDLVPIRGNPAIQSIIGPVTAPYALVARTNAGIFTEALTLAQGKIPFHVVGSLREPIEKTRSLAYLWQERLDCVSHPEIRAYDDWKQVLEEAKFDVELARFAKLIDRCGTEVFDLCDQLEGTGSVAVKKASVILVTAHKSKGLQYPQMRLANDYSRLKVEDNRLVGPDEERRILYVAATRAEFALELNELLAPALPGLV